jgi:adenylate cyclase
MPVKTYDYLQINGGSLSETRVAIPILEEALQLEPDYVATRAHLAWCYELCFTRGGFAETDKNAALLHARTVIASNTDDATALAVAGTVIFFVTREREMGLSTIDRALALNASCVTALYLGAMTNANADYPAKASALAERALRLSPFDSSAFEAHLALGTAAVEDSRYDEGASCFARLSQINSRYSTADYSSKARAF